MGLQNVITASGGLAVQYVANGFGVVFLGGYTAANKLYALLETAASSYGYAVSTYMAQNTGSGRSVDAGRVKVGFAAALAIGILTAAVMSGIMLWLGRPILELFLPADSAAAQLEEMTATGCAFLRILAAFFPLLYVLYIIRAGIQGMGNSVIPMLSSLVQVGMRMLCALFLVRAAGCAGIFWGEPAAWIGAVIFLACGLRKTAAWRLKEEGARCVRKEGK